MGSITAFALDNSRTVILSTLWIVIAGIVLYFDYPKLEDPSITIREAVVTAQFPGMSTERMERLITRPIEEAIRSMGEVKDLNKSTAKPGETVIHLTIKDALPADQLPAVWKTLRNKMDDVARDLPVGTIGPFVNDEFGDTAVATVALWSEGFSLAEMHQVARDARELLALLPGIKKIDLHGVQEERIYVEIENAKLAKFGINPQVIQRTLQEQNAILPGGELNINGINIVVEPSGRFRSLAEIAELLIPIPDSEQMVPLRDLAQIKRGYVEPPQAPAYYQGNPAIVLSIYLLPQVNAVAFGEQLTEKLQQIEQTLPWGYVFDYATYQPELVERAVNGMLINVLETLLIVLILVMLFLGWRSGLIVGFFVPLVMLFGIVVMAFFGIEMQRMSLASMIISLGMLVDNGIVMAEDIRTRMELGASRRQAALGAGQQLALPLLTSTLTTVFAFGIILLQEGSAGDYTGSLGGVVTILLLGSWFLALFVVTSACYAFIQVKPAAMTNGVATPYQSPFFRGYRRLLEAALAQRGLVLGLTLAAMIVAVYGFGFVSKTFFPKGDRNQYLIYLDLPANSRIEATDQTVRQITNWLEDKQINPEITGTIAYVGDGGPRFFLSLSPEDPDDYFAFLIVNTENSGQVPALVQRTRDYLLNQAPNVRARVKQMWLGPTETGLVEVRLSGPDHQILRQQAEDLMTAFRAVPGTMDIRQDWNQPLFRLLVNVDQAQARRAGITSEEVASSLATFIDGETTTDFYFDDQHIPIVGRGIATERNTLDQIYNLGIYSQSANRNVPLSQIAEIEGAPELSRIRRYNQMPTITVSAKHQVLAASALFAEIEPTLEQMDFPANHYWEMGGELEAAADAQWNLAKWIPFSLGGMIFLLVWQFNSFRRATIIMITIPLVFIGAILGLLVMQGDFDFMVVLGLLGLVGIIINNGIVLIDKIESLRQEGKTTYHAVVDASVARFRPILMSVTTTLVGFMPLIISKDPLFYSMASMMAWGLGIGTLFTLIVVPVLYSLFFAVKAPEM